MLDIDDPNDLNRDGSTTFDFPFVTIEDVLVIDEDTILVANDNNYPFSIGRGPDIDNNEIILLDLDEPLDLDPRLGVNGEETNFEPIFGNLEADTIEVDCTNQLVFAGEGDDLIDLSLSGGNNRVFGEGGDDTFILGSSDRLSGAQGDDRFFALFDGDNTITGGEGSDQFWVAVLEIPESANIITDFTRGEDLIGIALGIGFDDLSLTPEGDNTLIAANGSDLAILLGVEPESLSRK